MAQTLTSDHDGLDERGGLDGADGRNVYNSRCHHDAMTPTDT
jgi:hypothetical protein